MLLTPGNWIQTHKNTQAQGSSGYFSACSNRNSSRPCLRRHLQRTSASLHSDPEQSPLRAGHAVPLTALPHCRGYGRTGQAGLRGKRGCGAGRAAGQAGQAGGGQAGVAQRQRAAVRGAGRSPRQHRSRGFGTHRPPTSAPDGSRLKTRGHRTHGK